MARKEGRLRDVIPEIKGDGRRVPTSDLHDDAPHGSLSLKRYGPGSVDVDISNLIRLARDSAALQPDGSPVPRQRCTAIHEWLLAMVDPNVSNRLSTIALTYARRIARLVQEKVRGRQVHPDIVVDADGPQG